METKQNGMSVRKGKRKGSRVKWERAVSRKFYEAVCRQIREVAALSEEIDAANVIACLDEYIDRGQAQPDFTDMETVVFTLLQPQIDKAKARSRRARAAAARRREANVQADSDEEVAAYDECTANVTVQPQTMAPSSPELAVKEETLYHEITADDAGTDTATSTTVSPRDEKRAHRREAAVARRLMKRQKRLARRAAAKEVNEGDNPYQMINSTAAATSKRK